MDSAPHVAVVGGGSTGTGVARDLAMRGFDVTLVEQGNLTHGTTGRMHGLLHSGGRYAVADPVSAEECIAENRILRDVASHCVELTGGLFVKRPEDDEAYFQAKLDGCRDCGIPAEVVSGDEACAMEPHLAPDVEKAIAVPDGAVDPFRLVVANAASAQEHGARIETHATVTDVLVERGEVVGLEVEHDSGPGKHVHGREGGTEEIRADHVVNATGAWAGRIGEMAGVDVAVRPSKGAMVVTNVRQVDTVLNRCRPKGDGDILVPHETTAILGTTDVEVDDPEDYPEEQWEVDAMLDSLSDLVPMLADARTIRSFWGVRPLYEPPDVASDDPTDVTRDYFLLDHAARDDRPGLTSVVGGKFTTYRLMAEAVADHVCERFGVDADCRTAAEPLPGSEAFDVLRDYMAEFGLRSPIGRRSVERLGSRADDVLRTDEPNPVVCDCEGVTRAELRDAVSQSGSDLNAVRIRTRASMGNCQGGFCCHRMASELHDAADSGRVGAASDANGDANGGSTGDRNGDATDGSNGDATDGSNGDATDGSNGDANGGSTGDRNGDSNGDAGGYDEATTRQAWDDLLEERWKGQRHALWGEQLSQAMLNYALQATTQNRDRDPADGDGIDFARFDTGPPGTAAAGRSTDGSGDTDGGTRDGD